MKKTLKRVMVVSFVLGAGLADAKNIGYRDIPELLEENNQLIRSQDYEISAKETDLGHLKRSFVPELEIFAGQEEFSSEALGDHSTLYYGLSGKMNLFKGMQDSFEEKSREESLKVSKLQKELSTQELIFKGQKSYLKGVKAHSLKRLYREALERLRSLTSQVKKKVRSGVTSPSDLSSLKMLESKYQLKLTHLERQLSSRKGQLSRLLGMEEEVELKDKKVLQAPKLMGERAAAFYQSRLSETQSKYYALQGEKFARKKLPELNAFVDYGRLPYSERELSSSSDREEVRAGLQVTWDVGDIWEAQRTQQKTRYKEKASQLRSRYFENESARKLSQLTQESGFLRELIEKTSRQIKLAENYLSQVSKEFEKGVKSTSDLQSALTKVIETKKEKINLQLQYKLNGAKTQKLTGR